MLSIFVLFFFTFSITLAAPTTFTPQNPPSPVPFPFDPPSPTPTDLPILSNPAFDPPSPSPSPSTLDDSFPLPSASASASDSDLNPPIPSASASASTPIDPTVQQHSTAHMLEFLRAHNTVRAKHNAAPLTWSADLAEKAEIWANACNFQHTNGILSDTPYGENIVAATGVFPIKDAVATFIQDEALSNASNLQFTHFTQVVWKSTTDLGCAVSKCDTIFDPSLGPATLYVCLYNPVGNVVDHLLENVDF